MNNSDVKYMLDVNVLKSNKVKFSVVFILMNFLLIPMEFNSLESISVFIKWIPLFSIFALSLIGVNIDTRSFILFLVFSYIILILSSIVNIDDLSVSFFLHNISIIAGLFVGYFCFKGSFRFVLFDVLTLMIKLWVVLLAFQIILYIIYDEVYDFHNFIFPWSEARLLDINFDKSFLRLTGPHIEPGTYSNWIYVVVFLRGLISGRYFDKISIIGIISSIFTLSFWSFFATSFFILAYLLHTINNLYSKFYASAVIFLIFLYLSGLIDYDFVIFDYISHRILVESSIGDGHKATVLSGFLNYVPEFVFFGLPIQTSFCGDCVSPQDIGLILNLGARFGLMFSLVVALFISVYSFILYRFSGLFLLIPLLFSKLYYYDFIFWIVVGFSISGVRFFHGKFFYETNKKVRRQ